MQKTSVRTATFFASLLVGVSFAAASGMSNAALRADDHLTAQQLDRYRKVGLVRPVSQAECVAGSTCQAVGSKLQSYAQDVDARIGARMGAAEAGAKAHCLLMVTAEVSRVCGDEMASAGKAQCADLAYQQRDVALEAARQSQASSRALSSGDWKANCGW